MTKPSRIATVDVGTNTALLLVADVADGRLRPVHEAQRFVRLGEGVDASGYLRGEAMERLQAALRAYRQLINDHGATLVAVAGTSASRDAANREALCKAAEGAIGHPYEILSGEAEARWSFEGTVSAFPDLGGACTVIDVGGGSTEVVVGTPGHTPTFRRSVDLGAVRLTERFFAAQPPPSAAVAHAEAVVRAAFEALPLPAPLPPLVGTAGTASALGLLHLGAASAEALAAADLSLTADEVAAWRQRLLQASYDEVLALNPAVMQGRADVFPAGVLLLDLFLRGTGAPALRVSLRGLRHGLALRFLHRSRNAS